MASTYTNEAAITLRVGADRLLALTDRDQDGSADTGVLTAAITRAGDRINRRLAQRYGSALPFADIGDATPTPGEVQEIAEDLTLAYLYEWIDPQSNDAVYHREAGDTALERLRDGRDDIAGVARAKAHEGSTIAVYTSETPVFAGVDSSDISRTRGI